MTQGTYRIEQHCCTGSPPARRIAGQISKLSASILPGAALVFLPKCPLCLAAWLTFATGISFSAADAVWLRGSVVLLWVAVVALIAWRRVLPRLG